MNGTIKKNVSVLDEITFPSWVTNGLWRTDSAQNLHLTLNCPSLLNKIDGNYTSNIGANNPILLNIYVPWQNSAAYIVSCNMADSISRSTSDLLDLVLNKADYTISVPSGVPSITEFSANRMGIFSFRGSTIKITAL